MLDNRYGPAYGNERYLPSCPCFSSHTQRDAGCRHERGRLHARASMMDCAASRGNAVVTVAEHAETAHRAASIGNVLAELAVRNSRASQMLDMLLERNAEKKPNEKADKVPDASLGANRTHLAVKECGNEDERVGGEGG